MKKILLLISLIFAAASAYSQKANLPLPVRQTGGTLVYHADENGNRVPDYSYSGYMASETEIPLVPVKALVPAMEGDATEHIQAALNYVSSLKPDQNGFRGAVLLEPGRYEVGTTLWINASGVVLRGSGYGPGGTEIIANYRDRTTLIRFKGVDNRSTGTCYTIADESLPVGTMQMVLPGHRLKAGDHIRISLPARSSQQAASGQNASGQEAAPARMRNTPSMQWEREITSVDGDKVCLDAPLTYEISTRNGSADVCLLGWPGRIRQVGLENLRLTSVYDQSNPKDENHAWIAVAMENVRDAWVRRVEFRHFAGSAVYLTETASRITVEDCKSLQPVSEIGAERRYSFYTLGGQCLFQRLWAEYGYHDFAVGAGAPGPNAFVQCWSISPHSFSGTVDALSSGVLFDICAVHANALRFSRPDPANEGYSYTTANSMFWNSTAAIMSCPKPGSAQNWAFGAWAQFSGKGYWHEANSHVSPWSLFYAQLRDRTGKRNPGENKLITLSQGGTSSREDARRETLAARKPLILLSDWIDTLCLCEPLSLTYDNKDKQLSKVWQQEPYMIKKAEKSPAPAMQLNEGVLIRDGKILTGGRFNPAWWRGSLLPKNQQAPHLTRYALEPEGYRVVDDLDEVCANMQKSGILVMDHNYGLWYDRRRDDHERTSRIDGEVKAPFYELPFARSGQGRAWDGLSKYDLTQWNVWYWNRLKKYADLADDKGLVLFHQHYFQHNIIEAGAHWADFPWRSANNVNETGFPEPVPYAGNKRVFMAEHFYDVTHPVRRELHRNYIRKCLDNFAENSSVLHFISAEFTGPLHFVEFWLDVVSEWEKETGCNALIALSTTKEVQDAILKDPVRSKVVEAVDIRYWYVDENGKEFAPKGGLNLAPRQFERMEKPAKTSASEVYNMVSSYRRQYPQKAVVYSADSYPEFAWAAFMAGASFCVLPKDLPEDFLKDAASLSPLAAACWLMAKAGQAYIAYPSDDALIEVDLTKETKPFRAQWIDPVSGRTKGKVFQVRAGTVFKTTGKDVLWLRQTN